MANNSENWIFSQIVFAWLMYFWLPSVPGTDEFLEEGCSEHPPHLYFGFVALVVGRE